MGQAVTVDFTVSPPPAPTGSVTVTATTGESCTGILPNGSCLLTFQTAGPRTITASYSGDATFAPSVSTPVNQLVNQAGTTTALASSQNPSPFGVPVTFVATVAAVAPGAGTPTGTVTFYDGAAAIGASTLSAGVAAYSTTTALAAGTHSITGSYGGDANFLASGSNAIAQTVTQLPQTITFIPIPNQVQGTQVALVAFASSQLPVSSTSLTAPVCTVSGSTATLIHAGLCTIQAAQPGNAVYAAAPSVQQSSTVLAPPANFTITPIPSSETVHAGLPGVAALELQSVNGFNGTVTLSCGGGPAAFTCRDVPQSVKVNGRAFVATLVLFPHNTAPGTYTITFTGVSGSLTNSTAVKFTVK